MKMISFYLIIACLFKIPIKSYSNTNKHDSDSIWACKVIKIDKTKKRINGTNKAYIILIQDTVSKNYYTVVSLKDKFGFKNKIKADNVYAFKMHRYYKYDSVIQLGLKLSIHLDGIVIHIPFSWYTSNIYTTKNLKGLHFISP